MIDVKLIREDAQFVKTNLNKRIGFDTKIVDRVLELDKNWRCEKSLLDKLKAEKNAESKKIAEVKKAGGDIQKQLDTVKLVDEKISLKEKEVLEVESLRNDLLKNIPNMLDEAVPVGADDLSNKVIRTFGKKPEFNFKPREHKEICELNDWYDMEMAAKHSGSRFYYLKGELVMLEIALYSYVLGKMYAKGYTPVEVPPMLRKESIGKSVSLSDFAEAIYNIEGEDLCLIGTSEHALALLHDNETFAAKDLPRRYVGLSNCFRKEAGVTKDSKGIFRVHNFNKIEQFIFSKPEDSDKLHEEITANAEEIFQELELHYQVIDICSGDIGSFASRKFDIEAYLPGQDQYREMVSASNYRDYGARRLNCKYQDEKNELKLVHTLNSTAVALTRCMIAILEQHQTVDGNVKLPKVLRPYFGGKEFLK